MSFDGKTAVVTGAGSGIGQETALQLCEAGAYVVGLDIAEAGLNATAERAATSPGTFEPALFDLSKRDDCQQAIAQAVEATGRLDALCNVAGISKGSEATKTTLEAWEAMIGVNLSGTFWTCQAALPHLVESGGAIVNTASNTAVQGLAYFAAYSATKGGVVAMTRSLALEYIKTGVRINVVAPGFTDTPLNNNATDDLDQDAHWDLLMRATVPRGMAHPGEVARVIVWAASENASAVHGAVIHADQGLTAG